MYIQCIDHETVLLAANKGRGYSEIHLKELREIAVPALEVGVVVLCVCVCGSVHISYGVYTFHQTVVTSLPPSLSPSLPLSLPLSLPPSLLSHSSSTFSSIYLS